MVGFVMLRRMEGSRVCDYLEGVCRASSVRACWEWLPKVTILLTSEMYPSLTLIQILSEGRFMFS